LCYVSRFGIPPVFPRWISVFRGATRTADSRRSTARLEQSFPVDGDKAAALATVIKRDCRNPSQSGSFIEETAADDSTNRKVTKAIGGACNGYK